MNNRRPSAKLCGTIGSTKRTAVSGRPFCAILILPGGVHIYRPGQLL